MIDPYRFGAVDANIANVIALLHGEGTNGSTTCTDSSPAAKTYSAGGNAQVSTAQFKYGAASLLFDGTGDYFNTTTTPADFAFGTADFTVEAWIKTSATGAYRAICSTYQIFTGTFTLYIGLGTPGVLIWAFSGTDFKTGTIGVTTGAWVHVAVSRNSGTLRMFVDGVEDGTGVSDTNILVTPAGFRVGIETTSGDKPFSGYIDEVRVTKNVGRYTAGFTPPAAPLPDS